MSSQPISQFLNFSGAKSRGHGNATQYIMYGPVGQQVYSLAVYISHYRVKVCRSYLFDVIPTTVFRYLFVRKCSRKLRSSLLVDAAYHKYARHVET